MKVYMLNFGRPIGMESKIYKIKPEVGPPQSPWDPIVEEFNSEFEARLYFKKYYPDYYKELEIINA